MNILYIQKKFSEKMEEILAEDLDGVEFFERVDALCKDHEIAEAVCLVAHRMCPRVIVSGGFGYWLFEHGYLNNFDLVIIAPGGLRLNGPTEDDFKLESYIMYNGMYFNGAPEPLDTFVFLDDTFYSGTTRSKCASALSMQYRCIVSHSIVCYDGAHLKQTESLYRYWDAHPNRIEEVRGRKS